MRAFVRSQDKMCGHWPNRTYFNVGTGSPVDVNIGSVNYPNWLQDQLAGGNQEIAAYLDEIATEIIKGEAMAVVLEYDSMHSRSNAIWLVEFITNIIDGAKEE